MEGKAVRNGGSIESFSARPRRQTPAKAGSRDGRGTSKGKGPQEKKKTEAPTAGTHLELLVRLNAAGDAEVVSAKEVPGPAPDSNGFPGQWLLCGFKWRQGGRDPGIPDPFEMRSFALKLARP